MVKASMGHIRDLPKHRFGIDVENCFKPTYVNIKGKGNLLRELKTMAKDSRLVYLASDPDREGEAIAYHLVEALKIPEEQTRRVICHEITKRGILWAFDNPTTISIEKVNAQQARRLLDRIVGYKLSPLLWKKVAKGLSAGRVQSVGVKLIVEREKEITSFKKEEYWHITAILNKKTQEDSFRATLEKVAGNDVHIPNENEAKALVSELKDKIFIVHSITTKERKEQPAPPFITSTLQQQASIRLGFTAKKTMFLAQHLYEGVELGEEGPTGLITYMRTDSTRVSEAAISDLRTLIKNTFGKDYVSDQVRIYHSNKLAQEAHEAIRPTYIEKTPDVVRQYLNENQYQLYKLIWDRFVATQMKSAVFLDTEVRILAGRGEFIARGTQCKFDGFTRLLGRKIKKDEQVLPQLTEDEELVLKELTPSQHFTEPPPRFTEATLIKTLEKKGIGRPSTYAPIISTIQDRGYIKKVGRKLFPTELGTLVTEKLLEYFDDIMDVEFTSKLEEKLDLIEEGKADWIQVLRDFYSTFLIDLEKATANMESEKGKEPAERQLCEKCGKPMVVRRSRNGKFLGCSDYPNCTYTRPIKMQEPIEQKCPACGSPMVIKYGKRGHFLGCSRYPDCKSTLSIQKSAFVIPKGVETPRCEKCGEEMVIKSGKRGNFLACKAYPSCRNTKPIPKEWLEQSS
jgi:DNA topoisomerase-1